MAGWWIFDRWERRSRLKYIIPDVEEYIEYNFGKEEYEEVCTEDKAAGHADKTSITVCDDNISYDRDTEPQIKFSVSAPPIRKKPRRIEDLLKESQETFSQSLLRLITQKGLKDSDVYNKANISRQLFSKIRNDVDYQPTKKTVLSLAIAMQLNLDEVFDLLARAGFTLSPSKKEDLVVQYFLEQEEYDIFLINEVLDHFKLPTLF